MRSDEKLLNAILGDEDWRHADAAAKARVLGKFQSRHHLRRLGRAVCLIVPLSAALLYALWSPRPPEIAEVQSTGPQAPLSVPEKVEAPRSLTDKELLSFFPPGSCVVVEIDGEPQLFFLDPEMERQFFSKPRAN